MGIMKCHISATIDRDVVARAKKQARQTRRSVSNLIELALVRALDEEAEAGSVGLVTSGGRFAGRFDRGECYGDR